MEKLDTLEAYRKHKQEKHQDSDIQGQMNIYDYLEA